MPEIPALKEDCVFQVLWGKPCLKSTRSHRLERWLGGSECLLLRHKDQSLDFSGHVGWFVITWTLFCPLQGMFLEFSGEHVLLL